MFYLDDIAPENYEIFQTKTAVLVLKMGLSEM